MITKRFRRGREVNAKQIKAKQKSLETSTPERPPPLHHADHSPRLLHHLLLLADVWTLDCVSELQSWTAVLQRSIPMGGIAMV